MEIKPWGLKGSCFNEVINSSPKFASYIQQAIEMLPDEIFYEVIGTMTIICLTNQDGCRLGREVVENREIILISERLMPKNKESEDSDAIIYLRFVILHEIAHAHLKHRPPKEISPDVNDAQESEADSLALTWYNEYILSCNNQYLIEQNMDYINKLRQQNLEKLEALNA